MVDSAMFYAMTTFYPLVTRATYPTLGFPQYPGEVGSSEADDELKARAQRDATDALAGPLEVFETFYIGEGPFIGGVSPSIADIRLAVTLEFLRTIDYPFPDWAEAYMTAIEASLGTAYSDAAADVRGFVASAKAQTA
jgi:glutathione S-transferase